MVRTRQAAAPPPWREALAVGALGKLPAGLLSPVCAEVKWSLSLPRDLWRLIVSFLMEPYSSQNHDSMTEWAMEEIRGLVRVGSSSQCLYVVCYEAEWFWRTLFFALQGEGPGMEGSVNEAGFDLLRPFPSASFQDPRVSSYRSAILVRLQPRAALLEEEVEEAEDREMLMVGCHVYLPDESYFPRVFPFDGAEGWAVGAPLWLGGSSGGLALVLHLVVPEGLSFLELVALTQLSCLTSYNPVDMAAFSPALLWYVWNPSLSQWLLLSLSVFTPNDESQNLVHAANTCALSRFLSRQQMDLAHWQTLWHSSLGTAHPQWFCRLPSPILDQQLCTYLPAIDCYPSWSTHVLHNTRRPIPGTLCPHSANFC